METDNLVALKDDMVAFIEGHGLRRLPGYVTEDIPAILWEGEDNPDSPSARSNSTAKNSTNWSKKPAN
jgi:hypothetical protein